MTQLAVVNCDQNDQKILFLPPKIKHSVIFIRFFFYHSYTHTPTLVDRFYFEKLIVTDTEVHRKQPNAFI